MNEIITYDEDIFKDGALVNPNGEVIYTSLNIEGYAKNYCEGYYANVLRRIKEGHDDFYLSFEKICEIYNYNGKREDINIYLSSLLNKEELELLKKWLIANQNECGYIKDSQYTNFLIQILGWDKIETILKRQVTTPASNPYTKFWNYNLMDFEIIPVVPRKFNFETNQFENLLTKEWRRTRDNDIYVRRECEKIKKKYLTKEERMKFFRK